MLLYFLWLFLLDSTACSYLNGRMLVKNEAEEEEAVKVFFSSLDKNVYSS